MMWVSHLLASWARNTAKTSGTTEFIISFLFLKVWPPAPMCALQQTIFQLVLLLNFIWIMDWRRPCVSSCFMVCFFLNTVSLILMLMNYSFSLPTRSPPCGGPITQLSTLLPLTHGQFCPGAGHHKHPIGVQSDSFSSACHCTTHHFTLFFKHSEFFPN